MLYFVYKDEFCILRHFCQIVGIIQVESFLALLFDLFMRW